MSSDVRAELSNEKVAWLEAPGRDNVLIHGSCSIGRSAKNTILLDSPNIS
jgi:hypothetical protein